MNQEKKSYIIFLKGVSASIPEGIEDKFDEQLLENTSESEISSIEYDRLFNYLSSIDKWPKTTNLSCWNCTFTFTDIPISIPVILQKDTENNYTFFTRGNFCSFCCATRYLCDNLDKTYLNNLYHLFKLFYKKETKYLIPASSRLCMNKYGGRLSEDEFMKEIKKTEQLIHQCEDIKTSPTNKETDIITKVAWDIRGIEREDT